MKKIFSKFANKKDGYTLVEMLVAISIFTTSVLGVLVILAGGIADTGYAKQKMGAAYLAQEGVEYVRNMRDTFMIYSADPNQGWNDFKAYLSNCESPDGCFFDPDDLDFNNLDKPITQISIYACGGNCQEIKYDSASGVYGYTVGENSGFIRKIEMDQISANEVKIISTVFWTQGSGDYNVSFSDNFFNWIE